MNENDKQAEPVAWAETDEHGEIAWGEEGCFSNDPAWIENPIPLYTHPAQPVQPAGAVNQQELCPSCRNADIYACTCPFKTARNSQPECFEPAPAAAINEQLYQALRHLYHNAKKSGAEMGLALDVAEDALKQAEKAKGGV